MGISECTSVALDDCVTASNRGCPHETSHPHGVPNSMDHWKLLSVRVPGAAESKEELTPTQSRDTCA